MESAVKALWLTQEKDFDIGSSFARKGWPLALCYQQPTHSS
jgi:hypothetical protein